MPRFSTRCTSHPRPETGGHNQCHPGRLVTHITVTTDHPYYSALVSCTSGLSICVYPPNGKPRHVCLNTGQVKNCLQVLPSVIITPSCISNRWVAQRSKGPRPTEQPYELRHGDNRSRLHLKRRIASRQGGQGEAEEAGEVRRRRGERPGRDDATRFD